MTIPVLSTRWVREWLFGLLIGMLSSTAMAGPVNCGDKPISLAFFDFGLLYFEKDRRGQGIARDVVDELITRTGCKFITQLMPRARTWNDLSTGNLDMTVDGIVNQKRKGFGWFIPYNKIKNYALVKTKNTTIIRGPVSFRDKSQLQFGVVRSFNHGEELETWLDQMRAEKRVQESTNIEILFNKFLLGRVDAMFAPPPAYRKLLRDANIEDEVEIQDWAPMDKGIIGSLVLAKSRFSEEDASDWSSVVKKMRLDGTFKRIYSRYLSENDANWMTNF